MDDETRLVKTTRKQNKLPTHFAAAVTLTYNSDSSYLVHEQGRDDVARQHSQTAQEADHVDHDVVLLLEVQMAALFRVEEGGVFHSTVFELFLPEVWREQRHQAVNRGFLLSVPEDEHVANS